MSPPKPTLIILSKLRRPAISSRPQLTAQTIRMSTNNTLRQQIHYKEYDNAEQKIKLDKKNVNQAHEPYPRSPPLIVKQ
jgi:hypothetical protein